MLCLLAAPRVKTNSAVDDLIIYCSGLPLADANQRLYSVVVASLAHVNSALTMSTPLSFTFITGRQYNQSLLNCIVTNNLFKPYHETASGI